MMIRDGAWTLFDYDFRTGRQVWHMNDGERDVYRTDYPVTGIIEQNKTANSIAAAGWAGDWHQIASVPLNVAFDSGFVEAQANGDEAFVSRFLNDSDNRAWRTKDGEV